MRVFLVHRDEAIKERLVCKTRKEKASGQLASSVTVPGFTCPQCHRDLEVAGIVDTNRITSRDTQEAEAACVFCYCRVGTLQVVFDTLFGIEEDIRVLSGPWKVY